MIDIRPTTAASPFAGADGGACLCASGQPYGQCCRLVLEDHAAALTPLALMRSRYTAFVLGDHRHLLKSWAPETRPERLDLDRGIKWLGLVIHKTAAGANENEGYVDFTATSLEQDFLAVLRETSRFRRDEGLWYYVDGKTSVTRTAVARNSGCPCGSGKKFKRCCRSS